MRTTRSFVDLARFLATRIAATPSPRTTTVPSVALQQRRINVKREGKEEEEEKYVGLTEGPIWSALSRELIPPSPPPPGLPLITLIGTASPPVEVDSLEEMEALV